MNILDIWYSVDPMKPSHFNISVVMDKKVGANPGKPQLKVELQFRSLSNRDCSVGLVLMQQGCLGTWVRADKLCELC